MEKAIKQRLLGGLVLAAGAALFLPLVLDGSGSDLVLPAPPTAPALPAPEALAPALEAEVAAAEQAVAEAHAAPEEAMTEGEPAAPAEALVAAPASPVAVQPQAQAQAQAQDQTRAEQERLAREKAAAEAARLEKERQARLAAEAKARAEAEQKAREAAARTAATKPAPTTAPAPAAAADLPQAWVVQVASLSARDKADALAQKLRQKGYRSLVQGQEGAWKVLVGPELNRAVADTIKQKLAADSELKLSGWVQAWKP